MARGRGRTAPTLALVVSLSLVVVVGVVALNALTGVRIPFLGGAACSATVDGATVSLDAEQAENAATIAAVAEHRGLPARAVSIALATAYQESDLHNLDHGDRDSLGLFQQRPSQGWGTEEQVQDPVYAANAFYDALENVYGYRDLEITVAAQEVQRSGFPDAYADHEDDARVLASALTGNSPAAFTCRVDQDPPPADGAPGSGDLTPRAEALRVALLEAFGDLALGGFAPSDVADVRVDDDAHYAGRAVDVFFRPVSTDGLRRAWAVASYVVAHAQRLGVEEVVLEDRVWRAEDPDGWTRFTKPDSDRSNHRDHVHITVA